MNKHLVRILAAIAAAQTRVEAMRAHNLYCEMIGDTKIYAELAFMAEAALLELLSIEAREMPN